MKLKLGPETLYGFYLNDRVADLMSTSAVQGIRNLTGSVVRLNKKVLQVRWDSGRLERFSSAADASQIKKIGADEDW